MDQLKVILRQAIKHRFWIVVGVAALLPVIAYFASAGTINAETEKLKGETETAKTNVQKYSSGLVPTGYKPVVDERTGVLTKDVNSAWRLLYEKQAPLLTWPEEVSEQFTAWGKQWPEDVDDAAVAGTIQAYVQIYPAYVDKVYASFRPFDFKEGTGIVVAPERDALLRPAKFSMEEPPTLGQVWGAQQRLWIQQTVLDVVNKLNGQAEDWQTAPVKQITALEVASNKAQDQMSIAKGEVLSLAPEILKPGQESTASSAPAVSDDPMAAMNASMMEAMANAAGGGAAVDTTKPEELYIFTPESESQPFQVIPVSISVLIEQNRILDLIHAYENSPMVIQVVDMEMNKPEERVEKPEKGATNRIAGGMGMGMGGMMMGSEMILGGGSMMNMAMMDPRMGMGGMMSPGVGMMPGMNMGMGMPAAKKGTDIRSEQLKKIQEKGKSKDDEGKEEKKGSSKAGYSDPYFNVVEVRIFGQARFYNPPPAEEPEEVPADSTGEMAADDAATEGEAAPAAEEGTMAEEAPAAEPGEEPAQSEEMPAEPAAAEEATKDEPAPEPAPEDAPKAEEPPAPPAEATAAPEPKAEGPPAAPDQPQS